jgi:hypothetical protein
MLSRRKHSTRQALSPHQGSSLSFGFGHRAATKKKSVCHQLYATSELTTSPLMMRGRGASYFDQGCAFRNFRTRKVVPDYQYLWKLAFSFAARQRHVIAISWFAGQLLSSTNSIFTHMWCYLHYKIVSSRYSKLGSALYVLHTLSFMRQVDSTRLVILLLPSGIVLWKPAPRSFPDLSHVPILFW